MKKKGRHRVLKNVNHSERGLVRPDDENPYVDLSHLDPELVQLLVERGVVAPAHPDDEDGAVAEPAALPQGELDDEDSS